VLAPILIGVLIVLIYSKNLLNKNISDMRVLLTSFEDTNPKELSARLNRGIQLSEIIKNDLEFTKAGIHLEKDKMSNDDVEI
jgi:hypothetical protein